MASKPTGRPNLALAGKREIASPATRGADGSKRGRGRGRGRADNDRTKRGPQKKQELIQTGGVFSEGLGGEFPTRKKERDPDVAQFSFKRSGDKSSEKSSSESKEKEVDKTGKSDAKASFKGWDDLWVSDDEGDDAELKSLLPKGFISDYKRGTVIPFVLPLEDKAQFKNVLRRTAQNMSDDEEDDIDNKKFKKETGQTRTETMSPEKLIEMIEASTSNLLHLQLPSVIGSLCKSIEQHPAPMETEEDPNNSIETPNEQTNILPDGHRIGKLQITRKGRLLMTIGGYTIDITSKPTAGRKQATVLLQTEPVIDPLGSPPSRFSMPSSSTSNSDNSAVYHIGNVKHNLVGSMTWNKLNEHKAQKLESKNEEKFNGNVEKVAVEFLDASEVTKIQEFEEIQKSWMEKADNWARGVLE